MKKVLALVATAALFGSVAFAEKVVEVGLKGGVILNVGTKLEDLISNEIEKIGNKKLAVGGDIGIFGHFGFGDMEKIAFSLQSEVFFSLGNGIKYEAKANSEYTAKLKYTSMDIALLVGCDIPLGKARLTPFLGPKVGIPLGKMKEEDEYYGIKQTYEYNMKGATIGMDFGVGLAIPLGHFVLGADVRYGIDFNKMKIKEKVYDDYGYYYGEIEMDFLRRGALGINITAGYRF